jgi:maltooligosyltrehalose trehalohydrolase
MPGMSDANSARVISFAVWAPKPSRVELKIGERLLSMEPTDDGWWRTEVASASAGIDYSFVLDGERPLPDPRSPFQPYGAHGPSRVADHEQFPWTDAGWQAPPLSAAVLYELHVGTFSPKGTFEGAIDHLDHLVELGVTHVELMPVCEFAGARGWGYDGAALYAPHHVYGGPDGLKRLVDACHARRLAVILDVVYNHLGPSGNYLSRFGPYFTDRHVTPWGPALNLDGRGSDEVRRFVCDNALAWLRDYHVDGLRLDAVHALVDTSAVHLLEQLATEVEALEAQTGRHFVLVAESDLNDPRLVRPREAGGYGLDAQWSDDFHHALHTALTGERSGYYADFAGLGDVARALERVFVYDGRRSAFRGRRHGRPVSGLSGQRFVAYAQNHDQIGNRARGDRSSHLMGSARLKVAAAIVLTAPFVPMLFQGEEWGASAPFQYFVDHEAELAEAVRRGRCEEFAAFGWRPEDLPDPQALRTFDRSKLDWAERSAERHAALLAWHRALIRLRRSTPELTDGRVDRVRVRADAGDGWLVVERGRIVVAVNLGARALDLPLARGPVELLMASARGVSGRDGALRVPPDAVAIVRVGP